MKLQIKVRLFVSHLQKTGVSNLTFLECCRRKEAFQQKLTEIQIIKIPQI